jgi:hypothetical protein
MLYHYLDLLTKFIKQSVLFIELNINICSFQFLIKLRSRELLAGTLYYICRGRNLNSKTLYLFTIKVKFLTTKLFDKKNKIITSLTMTLIISSRIKSILIKHHPIKIMFLPSVSLFLSFVLQFFFNIRMSFKPFMYMFTLPFMFFFFLL